MDILIFLLVLILLVLLAYVGYIAYLWFIGRQSATKINADELEQLRVNAQIVDVREVAEFEARHILGARNIPISQFSQRQGEVRRDKAVYLYDDNVNLAPRAARILKKNGHDNIFILNKGFSTWTGKVKTAK